MCLNGASQASGMHVCLVEHWPTLVGNRHRPPSHEWSFRGTPRCRCATFHVHSLACAVTHCIDGFLNPLWDCVTPTLSESRGPIGCRPLVPFASVFILRPSGFVHVVSACGRAPRPCPSVKRTLVACSRFWHRPPYGSNINHHVRCNADAVGACITVTQSGGH